VGKGWAGGEVFVAAVTSLVLYMGASLWTSRESARARAAVVRLPPS